MPLSSLVPKNADSKQSLDLKIHLFIAEVQISSHDQLFLPVTD